MVSKKRIFITGGSGFIGSNLVRLLGSKYEIIFPSSKELNLLDSSAAENFIKEAQADVLINCVNIGGKRGQVVPDMVEKNLRIFSNVARCKKYYGKLIQCGSGAEYSKTHMPPKVKEDFFGKYVPQDGYGFYKYLCSKHIESLSEDMVCLRIFGCFGQGEDYAIRFISNNLCRAAFGMPIRIDNQNVLFDYLYVDDLANIMDYFIQHDAKCKFYNTTPDKATDLLSIARIIAQISGSGQEEIPVGKPGVGKEYSGDNSRLRGEIPGLKFTSLEDSISALNSYIIKNKGKIDRMLLG